ncbi:MAG: small multi-drug export protein [Gammaproteobacteria bacterium]|nr:small multi-drug export protein [Gammaproteobacteria bacterium]NIR61451.1 small multi-drug export protein [Gammaproteobacteria bacterium]NIR91286.1 small multi-drug export protein [Gammaproteobacteria bacterium]
MTRKRRAVLTAIPVALLGVAVGAGVLVLREHELASFFGLVLLAFPAGRFLALAPVAYQGFAFSPFVIAGIVLLVETCVALFVSVNLDVLHGLPRIGKGLRAMEQGGEATLAQHPWIRRTTWTGVALFLSLPLPTTGPVGGTVIARLIGLGPERSFAAVVAGDALGVFVVALAAHGIITWVPLRPDGALVVVLRLAVIVALIALLTWLWYRRTRRPRP